MYPIIGATKSSYIYDALAALEVSLTDEDIQYLEEAYVAHEVVVAL